MQQVLDQLFQITPDLSPQLRLAARVILDNPALVAVSSMRSLAKRGGVTPPTMIRLAKKLGYENYDSMRLVFQSAFTDQDYQSRASSLQDISSKGGESELLSELTHAATTNVSDFFQKLEVDELNHIADTIRKAPMVYLVAAGAPHWLVAYMFYVGRMAIPRLRMPVTSGVSLIDGLMRMNEGEVIFAISFAPYAKQTIEAARFAKTRGAHLIYLTDSRAAPLAAEADSLLLLPTSSPQFFPSMISTIAAIESLIALVVARSDDSTIKAIAEFDQIWRESNAFE